MGIKPGGRFAALIKAHPYAFSGIICILFWLLTGGSVRYLNNTGISARAMMFTYMALLLAVIITGIVLKAGKKLDTAGLIWLIAIGGVLARIWFAMYAQTTIPYQHDMGYFDRNPASAVHDNYMFYIYDNWKLPDFDIRGWGQFYHPPLHHFISAVAMRINELIFPGRAGNYEFLMCISLFYSLVTMILLYKIIRFFKFTGSSLVMSFMLVAFYPFLIISAGHINNDPLASMLAIASIYNALRWYKEPGFRRIICVALCIGFAMMSKLSAGLIAVPVAFIFLAALIRAKFKGTRLWMQYLSFAGVVFPLGLWFPLRNFFMWGIPPTYVFDLGNVPSMDLAGYSVAQRLFGSSEVSRSIPFVVFDENYKDFNIFTILFKSSLFDDLDHHDKPVYTLLAMILLWLGLALVIMCVAGLIKAVIRIFKERDVCLASVVILLITELAAIVVFAFKYPLICSENFRYVMPVMVSMVIFAGMCFTKTSKEWRKLLNMICGFVVISFAAMSVVFYMLEPFMW